MSKIVDFTLSKHEILDLVKEDNPFGWGDTITRYCRDTKGLLTHGNLNLSIAGVVTSWYDYENNVWCYKQVVED